MLRATDDHRRARLARRHGVAPAHRYGDVTSATRAMTALHATEPATPHLSLHARVNEVDVADVEAALYDTRTLVKVMGMRRTLFVVPPELIDAIAGSVGRRVADANRKRLEREAAALGLGPRWIDDARSALLTALDGEQRSTRELRDAIEHFGGTFVAAAGTKWATDVPVTANLLTIFCAEGAVVRARNRGHWRISRPTYTSMAGWLGRAVEPVDEAAGYAELVRRWLWTFGPGTEADLVWWLGATKRAVRRALVDVGALEVVLDDGTTGFVLPDDTDDLTAAADREPWVALLPTLDATTMGWRGREFYLDPGHVPFLFDTAGNAGTTVWVDGRVVGCWIQDDDGRVRTILRESLPRSAHRLLAAEVERLDALLGGERITNVFASPQMRGERLG